MKFNIRNYCKKDLNKVYEICLKTGNAGSDASNLYKDPKLLGHVYVGPYVELEPQSAFILEIETQVCGYIIGTKNSKHFFDKINLNWLPRMKKKYKIPLNDPKDYNLDDGLINSFYFPEKPPDFPKYPAHLHIDILPEGQGQGMGVKLMNYFFKYLEENKVRGLHLGVDEKNKRAIRFYKKYGLKIIQENDNSIIMGKTL
tara:strand:- start:78 stop:677 length:600 start_codon:yes stop_codon:yes gene_type:complete